MMEPDAVRQILLERKLGRLLNWKPPAVQQTVGPYDPTPLQKFDEERRELIEMCWKRLSQFDDEEIAILRGSETSEHTQLHRTWRAFAVVDIEQLKNCLPPWYAAGLGHPDYRADFDHWSKASFYSIPEAASLSVGVEPGYFDGPKLCDLMDAKPEKLHPVLQFLKARYDLINREFDPQRSNRRVAPDKLLLWIDRFDIEVPQEFLDGLRRHHHGNAGDDAARPKKLDKREIDTVAQLFTAMAIELYGYTPGAKRTTVTKDIADLAASLGIEVHTDTVLKYLRLGAGFIDKDWIAGRRYSDKE